MPRVVNFYYSSHYIRWATDDILPWSQERERVRKSRLENDEDWWQCLRCDNSYDSTQSLRKHYRAVHEEIRYLCPFGKCNDQKTRLLNLKQHVQAIHTYEMHVIRDASEPKQLVEEKSDDSDPKRTGRIQRQSSESKPPSRTQPRRASASTSRKTRHKSSSPVTRRRATSTTNTRSNNSNTRNVSNVSRTRDRKRKRSVDHDNDSDDNNNNHPSEISSTPPKSTTTTTTTRALRGKVDSPQLTAHRSSPLGAPPSPPRARKRRSTLASNTKVSRRASKRAKSSASASSRRRRVKSEQADIDALISDPTLHRHAPRGAPPSPPRGRWPPRHNRNKARAARSEARRLLLREWSSSESTDQSENESDDEQPNTDNDNNNDSDVDNEDEDEKEKVEEEEEEEEEDKKETQSHQSASTSSIDNHSETKKSIQNNNSKEKSTNKRQPLQSSSSSTTSVTTQPTLNNNNNNHHNNTNAIDNHTNNNNNNNNITQVTRLPSISNILDKANRRTDRRSRSPELSLPFDAVLTSNNNTSTSSIHRNTHLTSSSSTALNLSSDAIMSAPRMPTDAPHNRTAQRAPRHSSSTHHSSKSSRSRKLSAKALAAALGNDPKTARYARRSFDVETVPDKIAPADLLPVFIEPPKPIVSYVRRLLAPNTPRFTADDVLPPLDPTTTNRCRLASILTPRKPCEAGVTQYSLVRLRCHIETLHPLPHLSSSPFVRYTLLPRTGLVSRVTTNNNQRR